MKTLIALAVAAVAVAACEPVHHVQRLNTCAFAGIEEVELAECATRGAGVYNIAKASNPVIFHNGHNTDLYVAPHTHETMPKQHMIHGMVHMEGCKNGGTKAHYHNGKLYHRVCK